MSTGRRTVALAIGSPLVVLALAWVALVLPVQGRAGSGAVEIDRLRAELAIASRPSTENDTTSPEVPPSLQAALRRAMPAQPMTGDVIQTMARVAHQANISLSSISFGTPAATPDQGAMTTIPVRLSVQGGYREIVAFADHLNALVAPARGDIRASGRLISIGGVEIDTSPTMEGASGSLTSRIEASTYTMPAEGGAP